MVKHVRPISRRSAEGKTARVYEQMRREFGVHAEPISLHSPAPEIMFGVWSLCRETLVVQGRVNRAVKEAVATAISQANRCPFCVDAHAVMLAAAGHYTAARRLDRAEFHRIDEPELAEIVEWAVSTCSPDREIPAHPPFERAETPELMGTVMLFHYINRPVNAFLGESPFPFDGHIFKGGMLRIGARRFKPLLHEQPTPGLSLDLLPEAELPEDMAWASGSPILAAAWGRFTAAVERAGEVALPAEVRAHLNDRLTKWNGEDPSLGTSWIEESLVGLPDDVRSAGRLALLAAIAPYRIDDGVIEDFRDGRPDRDIVAAVSWAALAAARRIGSRLLVPA